jgi:hypothetical protein
MEVLTPPGVAGVAVYRLRPEELGALAALASRPIGAAFAKPLRTRLRLGEISEDALLVGRADGSMEAHVHGAAAVDAAFLATFGAPIARCDRPVDRLLRSAMGAAQIALALEQVGRPFDEALVALSALPTAVRREQARVAIARSRAAMALAHPCPLHLVGRQNAGKSTAFNRLLGRERSLAGATPGLTRDAVAEAVLLAGYPYLLHDHAGEGDAAVDVDRDAISRSRMASSHGLRVLLVDASIGPDDVDRRLARDAHVVVATKADLPAAAWPVDVPCHASCRPLTDAVADLQDSIGAQLRIARGLPIAGPVGGFAALDGEQLQALERLADARL